MEYKNDEFNIYGISQNPDTKDYILVLQDGYYCEGCGEMYTEIWDKWCNPCQIKNLKENFKNWTSGNEKIDEFIQEKQLKVNSPRNIIFLYTFHHILHNSTQFEELIYKPLYQDFEIFHML